MWGPSPLTTNAEYIIFIIIIIIIYFDVIRFLFLICRIYFICGIHSFNDFCFLKRRNKSTSLFVPRIYSQLHSSWPQMFSCFVSHVEANELEFIRQPTESVETTNLRLFLWIIIKTVSRDSVYNRHRQSSWSIIIIRIVIIIIE